MVTLSSFHFGSRPTPAHSRHISGLRLYLSILTIAFLILDIFMIVAIDASEAQVVTETWVARYNILGQSRKNSWDSNALDVSGAFCRDLGLMSNRILMIDYGYKKGFHIAFITGDFKLSHIPVSPEKLYKKTQGTRWENKIVYEEVRR